MSNNVVLNSLFSQSSLNKLVDSGSSSTFETCLKRYAIKPDSDTNKSLLREVYNYIGKNYRNEYFYKNTIFNKMLLGKYSLNTSSALTELPVHNSKADLIIINGKAIVYEIKTELDSFDRLNTQLADYFKAFPLVYLVTSESQEEKAQKILKDSNVGILILTKKNSLSERKVAKFDYSILDKRTMFNILRKHEFEHILLEHIGFLPETSPVFYYRECYYLLDNIDTVSFYNSFIKMLKKRNEVKDTEMIKNIPYELRSAIYFSKKLQAKYIQLTNFLNEERRSF
ncbi:sce7726 family protein [Planococcus plakortidis]|uniref:sce7726 family protein n=1 Tax=Planococcus plakortidis TaxID=1038856 RepID=UPI003985532A